jgi:hypothetical protein
VGDGHIENQPLAKDIPWQCAIEMIVFNAKADATLGCTAGQG